VKAKLVSLRFLFWSLLGIYSSSRGIVPMSFKQLVFLIDIIMVISIPVLIFINTGGTR